MKLKSLLVCIVVLGLAVSTSALLSACSGSGNYSGRSSVHYGVGYRGYYGRPWGYPPVYVGGGIDPDWGGGGTVATPLPDMGMPDIGGGMDMGGFDW